jgi:hypothetical protein
LEDPLRSLVETAIVGADGLNVPFACNSCGIALQRLVERCDMVLCPR